MKLKEFPAAQNTTRILAEVFLCQVQAETRIEVWYARHQFWRDNA
jgi:hypothetical protein